MSKYLLGRRFFGLVAFVFILSGCDPTLLSSSEDDSSVEVSVGSGEVDVDIQSNFQATFSREVDPSTVTSSSFFVSLIEEEEVNENINPAINTDLCDLNNALSGTITCEEDELSCTLELDSPLATSTNYILCLTSDIQFRDSTADTQFEGISHSFVTEATGEEESGSGGEEQEEEAGDEVGESEEEVEEEEQGQQEEEQAEVEEEVDEISPTVGAAISFLNIDHESMTVSWGIASDDTTAASGLEYKLVRSTSEAAIDTIGEANSIAAGNVAMDWTENTLTKNIDSLSYPQTYYYAVIVRDESANMSLYSVQSQATVDEVAPTAGEAISFSNVDNESITVSWGAASDNAVLAANLEYKLVMNTVESAIDTLAEVNAIVDGGNLVMDWTANDLSEDINGLDFPETYYFAVLVRDTAGNIAYYSSQEQATLDAAAPTDGGGLAMVTPDCGDSTVSWNAATDNVTAQADLEYRVYYSNADNISTVEDIQANGTALGNWTANMTNATLTGLTDGDNYWVNVLVRDEAGNISAYTEDNDLAGAASAYILDVGDGIYKMNLSTGASEEIIDNNDLDRNMAVDENCEIFFLDGFASIEVWDTDGNFIEQSAQPYLPDVAKMSEYGDYIVFMDLSGGPVLTVIDKTDFSVTDTEFNGLTVIGVEVFENNVFLGVSNLDGFVYMYDFDSATGSISNQAQATINGSNILGGGWVSDFEMLDNDNLLVVYPNHQYIESYSVDGTTLTLVDAYEFGGADVPMSAQIGPDNLLYVLLEDGSIQSFNQDLELQDADAYDLGQNVGFGELEFR